MRRNLMTLTLAGLFGTLLLASDASACHKHKKSAPCPAPAPVVYCEPAPVVVACAPAPKKCHMKMPKMPKMGCHKKAVTTCAPTMTYAAPVYSAPVMGSPQATGQSM